MAKAKKDKTPAADKLADTKLPMGDGIAHLKETLYDIRPETIIQAKRPDDIASLTKYTWFNPRFLTANGEGKGEDMGHGFDRERMARLREDIINHGLHNPLICRWIEKDGVLRAQLVDGHRRLLVIEYLKKRNEKVFDQHRREFVPAKEKFASVVCHVYHAATDEDCLALAYQESKSRVDFGPEADLKIVRMLRNSGKGDEEILSITGQKGDWLKKMDNVILTGDEELIGAFCEGFIDLAAAELLAQEVQEIRSPALVRVIEFANAEAKKNVQRLARSIQKDRESIEVAKADKAEAEFKNDEDGVRQAKEKQEVLEKQVDAKQKEKEEVKPQADRNDAKKAVEETAAATGAESNGATGRKKRGSGGRPSGAGDRPQTLGYKKIKSRYLDPLEKLILNDGADSDGSVVGPIDYLKALHAVVKGIYTGEEEPMKIFRKYGARFVAEEAEPEPAGSEK